MTGENEVTGFVERDYSAVDIQIHQMALREKEITRQLRYANLFELAKVVAIFCGAVGLFLLLAGLAWRSAQSFDRKEVNHTIVEYKGLPEQRVIVNPDDPTIGTEIDPRVSILGEENEGAEIKKDLTYFVEKQSGLSDFDTVVTGVVYEKASDLVPTKRYCYTKRILSNGTSERVDIGFQESGSSAEMWPRPVTSGLSEEKFLGLSGYCAWGANAETVVQ